MLKFYNFFYTCCSPNCTESNLPLKATSDKWKRKAKSESDKSTHCS